MERETSDRFVRLIASAGTRRDAVRLVAVAALAGGAATLEETVAKRRRRRGRLRAQQATTLVCPGPSTLRDCSNAKIGPGVNVSKCDFIDRVFMDLNLAGANVSGASFFLSTFGGYESPIFRGANASNVCFGDTSLGFADFRSANVRGAEFCGADVRGADFRGSNLLPAQLACVAGIGCNTILPNGKPAVVCEAGQICCGAACCTPEECENNTCIIPPFS